MDLDNLVSAAIFIIVFFIFFFIGKVINDLLHREYKLNFGPGYRRDYCRA
jgi:hypothetical protein